MLVGTAFASPLRISELEIRKYTGRLPKGPTADISASIVYANFSVGETSVVYNKNVTDLSYFVVLNITNNSDEWAAVDWINFDAAEEITQGKAADSVFSGENWTDSVGWEAEAHGLTANGTISHGFLQDGGSPQVKATGWRACNSRIKLLAAL